MRGAVVALALSVLPAAAQTTDQEKKMCAEQGGCVTFTRAALAQALLSAHAEGVASVPQKQCGRQI